MSINFSDTYTTNLRAQSKILNGQKTHTTSKKYITLIKNLTKKEKSKKSKSGRIISKSVQSLKPHKNKDKKQNKKVKSKQKFEKFNKKYKKFNNKKNFSKSKTIDLNNENTCLSPIRNENEIKNKFESIDNDMNNKYFMYNTLQNNHNYSNFTKFSKTYNNNYIKNYFDIFKFRKYATSVRDQIKNNNHNSNLDLFISNNIENNKEHLQTYSSTNPNNNKLKTSFKANKLKEEIEKSLSPNSNFHPSSSLRVKSKTKINEIFNHNDEEEKNCYNKNNKYDENDDNNVKDMTYHFFDKNAKMPKRIRKYVDSSESNLDSYVNNLNNNKKEIKLKNSIKNGFRRQSNILSNTVKLHKNSNLKFSSIENKLNRNTNIDQYKNGFINLYNNKKKLNLITQENLKLNNLLRKIPSSRKFRNKSIDLVNYVLNLRKYKNNNILLNNENINNNICVYPPNECDAYININNDFLNKYNSF